MKITLADADSMSPMNLGELIDALDGCGAQWVQLAIPTPSYPARVSSYRGYYEDLAIEYDEDSDHRKMSVGEFLRMLRAAIGYTFAGYKGGNYTMSRESNVWVANWGNAPGTRVVGVVVDDDIAYLVMIVKWRQ